MCGYVVKSQGGDIVQCLGQPMGSNIVWGAGFELERQFLENSLLEADTLYHFSSTLIRRHHVEPLLLTIQYAHASRAVHLMSTEGKEVAVEFLNINLHVRSALRSVNHHRHVVLVCYSDNLLYGIDCTEHIADLRNTDDAGSVVNQLLKLINDKVSLIGHWYHPESNALLCSLQLPRHDVGMVLHD